MKIAPRWFSYELIALNTAYALGIGTGMAIGIIILIFYTIFSPILMWLPIKELSHPTLLERMANLFEGLSNEAHAKGKTQ